MSQGDPGRYGFDPEANRPKIKLFTWNAPVIYSLIIAAMAVWTFIFHQ